MDDRTEQRDNRLSVYAEQEREKKIDRHVA